jgi:hypothetical protein
VSRVKVEEQGGKAFDLESLGDALCGGPVVAAVTKNSDAIYLPMFSQVLYYFCASISP